MSDLSRGPDRTSGPGSPASAKPAAPSSARTGCADVITVVFLLLTVSVIVFTLLLIANPASPLNPFPPPTQVALIVIATWPPSLTPTHTFTPEPPTPTPIASLTPTFTPTVPTNTPTITFTPVIFSTIAPIAGTPPTRPPYTQSPFPFTVNPIKYVANTTSDGCKWQSIVVSVLDLDNKPLRSITAHVFGSTNVDEYHSTAENSQFGDNTFEVLLGSIPREDTYTIQLVSRTGTPISDAVSIQTHAACNQNVAVVTFVQNHAY